MQTPCFHPFLGTAETAETGPSTYTQGISQFSQYLFSLHSFLRDTGITDTGFSEIRV